MFGSINMVAWVTSITATNENSSVVTLKSTDVEDMFDIILRGPPLGTIDCSTVEVPTLPLL